MSLFLRFLSVVEKSFIVISIASFIPITVLIFTIKDPQFTTSQLDNYVLAYQQVNNPFIIDYKNGTNEIPLCTYRQSLLNNAQCLQKADVKTYSVWQQSNKNIKCLGTKYIYDGIVYCSGTDSKGQSLTIKNQFVQSSTASQPLLSFSENKKPIFKVNLPFNNPSIVNFMYVANGKKSSCQQSVNSLHVNIQERSSFYVFKAYDDSMILMWYILLIMFVLIIVFLIINQISTKVNSRPYVIMSYSIYSAAAISIIIKGIQYYTQTENMKKLLKNLSDCFVDSIGKSLKQMAVVDYGVKFGFIFFLGIVAMLLGLIIIGQIILKILEYKYYAHRDDYTESGYELQAV